MTLLFSSHQFFLDVGSPVDMVLPQPLTLAQDQVADAVRQFGTASGTRCNPSRRARCRLRPDTGPPPGMPGSPGTPPTVIPGAPGPGGVPGPPIIIPGTPPGTP